MDLKEIAVQLFDIGCIKFGDFVSVDNVYMPVYVDFRHVISHPQTLQNISQSLWSIASDISPDLLCGIPYTALPVTTLISANANLPMVLRRKESKNYGTKKLIEGAYNEGDNVLIVDDVVLGGSSIMETVRDLNTHGLIVTHALVILDREQGGTMNLARENVHVLSLYTLRDLLQYICDAGRISTKTLEDCLINAQNTYVKFQSIVLR